MSNIVPIIFEKDRYGERSSDVFSHLLNKERIVFLSGPIDTISIENAVSQIMFLDLHDDREIKLCINSAGGSVQDGLFLCDTIKSANSQVSTICCGQCSSMASVILSCGTNGMRYILPYSHTMIHKVSSGFYGKEPDIMISAEFTENLNNTLINILAENCGRSFEELNQKMDRDCFMNAQESVELGIVDNILYERI